MLTLTTIPVSTVESQPWFSASRVILFVYASDLIHFVKSLLLAQLPRDTRSRAFNIGLNLVQTSAMDIKFKTAFPSLIAGRLLLECIQLSETLQQDHQLSSPLTAFPRCTAFDLVLLFF